MTLTFKLITYVPHSHQILFKVEKLHVDLDKVLHYSANAEFARLQLGLVLGRQFDCVDCIYGLS